LSRCLQSLVQRTLIGTGSAILAARLALQFGIACMTNGGTHHAHKDHGTGNESTLLQPTQATLCPEAASAAVDRQCKAACVLIMQPQVSSGCCALLHGCTSTAQMMIQQLYTSASRNMQWYLTEECTATLTFSLLLNAFYTSAAASLCRCYTVTCS
jgi:hypothetical protein